MIRLVVATLVFALSGCFILNEHGKGGGDDDCLVPASDDPPLPGALSAPQRSPFDLSCQSLGGGTCDPSCGPCPETGADLAPIPSWGFCFSACEANDEATCEADDRCRVIKDARCAIDGTCLTDFLGCVEADQFVDPSIDCTQVTDAETCSRNPACTGYYEPNGCAILDNNQTCSASFAFCGPEGRGAGRCFEQAACDRLPPSCPAGTTPGVANGCFTDACIPNALCEPVPGV